MHDDINQPMIMMQDRRNHGSAGSSSERVRESEQTLDPCRGVGNAYMQEKNASSVFFILQAMIM